MPRLQEPKSATIFRKVIAQPRFRPKRKKKFLLRAKAAAQTAVTLRRAKGRAERARTRRRRTGSGRASRGGKKERNPRRRNTRRNTSRRSPRRKTRTGRGHGPGTSTASTASLSAVRSTTSTRNTESDLMIDPSIIEKQLISIRSICRMSPKRLKNKIIHSVFKFSLSLSEKAYPRSGAYSPSFSSELLTWSVSSLEMGTVSMKWLISGSSEGIEALSGLC